MQCVSIEDGTWTLRIQQSRGSVWIALITRSSVNHPHFQRARFVLGDETILILAEHLRAALGGWLAETKGRSFRLVKIDTERSTVDGFRVEIQRGA
jgi:hypothetical protein